jgi:peptidoglycan/LPS O-acetylase OafA/YrhL
LATAWCRVLLWGIPASFLVAGGVGMERAAGWTVPNWLVGLGTISYSLYLVHPFTPQIVAHALRWTGCPSALAADFGMAALSLALGAACWYFVERPLTRAAQGVVARHWRVPIQEVASPLREQNAGVDGRTD